MIAAARVSTDGQNQGAIHPSHDAFLRSPSALQEMEEQIRNKSFIKDVSAVGAVESICTNDPINDPLPENQRLVTFQNRARAIVELSPDFKSLSVIQYYPSFCDAYSMRLDERIPNFDDDSFGIT